MMCPRIWLYPGVGRMDSPEDGRFFAALRMTCFAIAIGEICRSGVGTNCHPEEAPRLTKDLLRYPNDVQSSVTALSPPRSTAAPLPVPRRGRGRGRRARARISFRGFALIHPYPTQQACHVLFARFYRYLAIRRGKKAAFKCPISIQ